MQLWRFMKYMICVTILALIYIHMQMNIFSLAYDGKQKEKHVIRLREQNGRESNNIFELKSANYIGRKMLNRGENLRFYDEKNVVQIVASKSVPGQEQAVSRQDEGSNPLSRLLAWRFPREAQAKEDRSPMPWQRR